MTRSYCGRATLAKDEGGRMTEVAEAPTAKRAEDVKRITHWIGGGPVEGSSGRSGPVFNPAAGLQTGEVGFGSGGGGERAVQAAKEGFERWRAMSVWRKTEIFFRSRRLVDVRREDIA